MDQKQVKANNHPEKEVMWVNEFTVAHSPEKVIIDFRQILSQFLPNNEPLMNIAHKTVILDPFLAKNFLEALKDNISKYEEKFGEIKEPESMIIAKKEQKKSETTSSPIDTAFYTG